MIPKDVIKLLISNVIKGMLHCFSMKVVINKCFLLSPEKNWRRSVLSFSRKMQKTHTLIPTNDVTDPKVRLL